MLDQIKQLDYQYLVTDNETPRAAGIVNTLTESGSIC